MAVSDAVRTIDVNERKRLGQYFTGEALARVLAALGEAAGAQTLVDPMAGSGDMLVAARQVGATAAELTAVEIDPIAATLCSQRLRVAEPNGTTVVADAFSPDTWADRTKQAWDLVITNPPYVRYQRTARGVRGRVSAPSASDVRAGLVRIIGSRETLTADERGAFRALADGYSGLADLAVPSWILCASLVAPDGRLAMVVPDTWLSRDYALPVLYLLRRYFDVEYVIEDGEAGWFEDALVRTTLVVARRVEDRGSALDSSDVGHVHARLSSAAADHRSLVGALCPSSRCPEQFFAQILRGIAHSRQRAQISGLTAVWTKDRHFRDQLLGQAGIVPWIRALEPKRWIAGAVSKPSSAYVPRSIREILGETTIALRTLADCGWCVGQGLRTGANRFFYAESIRQGEEVTELGVDPALSKNPLIVPNPLLRIVVRKQQDLPSADGDPRRSPGRLIALAGYALVEDIASAEAAGVDTPYAPIPEPLAEHVRRASWLDVGTAEAPRLLPDLSAVITNVRPADTSHPDRPPRFWYHLPPLAPRHLGVLFVPRINHYHPFAATNPHGVVIDANFSTLWRGDGALLSPFALAALLHSTWALLAMEASGTVLGGGALKIEATQLRRLPLPSLTAGAIARLDDLGHRLELSEAADTVARAQIDNAVWPCLDASLSTMAAALDSLRNSLLRARNPRSA